MSSWSIRQGAVVLALLLVAAGCGSSGSDSGGEATGSSRPPETTAVDGGDFVTALDGVCLDLQTALDALEAQLPPIDPATDLTTMSGLFQQSAQAYDDAAAAASELTPPAELQGRFDDFTGLLQDFADTSQQLADAAAGGDQAALEELLQSPPDGSTDLAGVAGDLGLTCFAATAAPPDTGSGSATDVQAYCDQVTAYVEAVDAYLADPASVDPGPITAQGTSLATASSELSADASAADRAALVDCARQASDAASTLLDALSG